MFQPRDYQLRACADAEALPGRVAIVAPTGAGKTAIAAWLVRPGRGRGLVFAHTRDLVLQMAEALTGFLGEPVGVIMAGVEPTPFARVQVASVQTLLAREWVPEADVVVWDEMHHGAAKEWSALIGRYPRLFGLTATPERADGVTLRGAFDHLVVAAHYSELIRRGMLVPARVLRPKAPLRGVALDPVTAYLQHGEGRSGFLFGRTIKLCQDYAEKLTAFGVPAACVDATTPSADRAERIAGLSSGRYRILTSVYALTEGVNVPAASVCVLARGCSHVSLLLQMAGRILRSCEGKTDGLLLDLPGVTWGHGSPHEDREYSLDGIKRPAGGIPLSVCQACGFTQPPSPNGCGRCGFKPEAKDLAPRVFNEKLAERPQATPLERQLRLSALLIEAERKGYQDDWIDVQYRRLFGVAPTLPHNVERKMAMWQKLIAMGKGRGYAGARYRALYGASAPRGW